MRIYPKYNNNWILTLRSDWNYDLFFSSLCSDHDCVLEGRRHRAPAFILAADIAWFDLMGDMINKTSFLMSATDWKNVDKGGNERGNRWNTLREKKKGRKWEYK